MGRTLEAIPGSVNALAWQQASELALYSCRVRSLAAEARGAKGECIDFLDLLQTICAEYFAAILSGLLSDDEPRLTPDESKSNLFLQKRRRGYYPFQPGSRGLSEHFVCRRLNGEPS